MARTQRFEMHRRAAVDDGAQAAMVGGGKAWVIDQPADHRRRGEEADVAVDREQSGDLVGVETRALGNDGVGAHGDEGQAVTAGAMRHRRRMQHAIAGADRLDLGEIGERLRQHDAVGQHRALRAAGRAAGIEEPGEIVRRARHDVDAVAVIELPPLGAFGDDRAPVRRHVLGAIGTGEHQRSLGMADDVGELLAMEFGVHRHRDQAGVPDREQSFEKFRPVGHRDRNAIARAA